MTYRTRLLATAALAAVVSTPALAQGFSFGSSYSEPVRAPGHNRYAPHAGIEDVPRGQVYSSGYYTSKARAADGAHNRYTD